MNETRARTLVLTLSFIAFVLSFAAWLMFGVLGVKIQEEFGLTDMQLGLLGTIALINGSIWRLPFAAALVSRIAPSSVCICSACTMPVEFDEIGRPTRRTSS